MPDVAPDEVDMDVRFVATCVLLGVTGLFDLRYKKIPIFPIIIGSILGGAVMIAEGAGGGEILSALLPGMLLIIVAFVTREKIGYGDGFLLVSLGLLEGAGACWEDLMMGLFFAAMFGIILLVFGEKGKETEVPFVPFLMAAHLLRLIPRI